MITAGDFRKGITIEWDGGVWNIVDFQHVKPGKGAAFVADAGSGRGRGSLRQGRRKRHGSFLQGQGVLRRSAELRDA